MSDDKKREETKAKLRAFLRSGDTENVQSVLVHTLMEHASARAEDKKPAATDPKPKKKK